MFQTAVQLYSFRDQCAKDFVDMLKLVAIIGFKGVEPAGFYNLSPKEFRKIVNDLGMEVCSAHGPWLRSVEMIPEAIDTLGELGLKTAVCGYGQADFKTLDDIKRTAELTNAMQEKLEAAGITLFQHNHYWEFNMIGDRLAYDIYAELCPKVKFQIDAFWSTNFGAEDPVEMLKLFADRTVLLHMKDGILKETNSELRMVNGTYDRKIDLRPLGQGQLDIPAILAAAPERIDNVVIELDYCSVEMRKAIRESYEYMVKAGLGYGNK